MTTDWRPNGRVVDWSRTGSFVRDWYCIGGLSKDWQIGLIGKRDGVSWEPNTVCRPPKVLVSRLVRIGIILVKDWRMTDTGLALCFGFQACESVLR